MKITDLQGPTQILNSPTAPTPSFSIDQRQPMSPMETATTALSSSQTMLDASKVFTSPLHNIASGNGADNLQSALGAGKQALADFSSAGAQNAGPIGQGMLNAAPGLKPAFQGLQQAVTPTNMAQQQGAAQTKLGEFVVPTAIGAGALDTMPNETQIQGAKSFMGNVTTPEQSQEVNQIADTISPKLNAKETKLALDQGRIIPGQDPSFLRDGTPDRILPAEGTQRAAETIQQQIPGAVNLKAPELYSSIDNKIGEISTNLRPQMEQVSITEPTVNQITNDWNALKAKQAADPYMPTNINLDKLQNSFEQDILQASKANNLGDLWDARIKYDNSVPMGVKNATSLSSDSLQAQKSIWLQNRSVLNNAINDLSNGLGGTSKQAFSNMSDMYNALKGIQSSYKVPEEGTKSLLSQFLNSPKAKLFKAVATAGGLYEGAKKLITGQF